MIQIYVFTQPPPLQNGPNFSLALAVTARVYVNARTSNRPYLLNFGAYIYIYQIKTV